MTHYFPHREAQLKHLFEAVDAAAPTPQRILEIGSGLGTITAKAAEHWPSARITGVDLDPVAVHVGQSLGKPTVDLILGDVTQPGWEKAWEPGSFDVVFSVTSLHYLTADQLPQVAAGVAALLREGGVFANYDRMTHPRFVTPPLRERRRLRRWRDLGLGGCGHPGIAGSLAQHVGHAEGVGRSSAGAVGRARCNLWRSFRRAEPTLERLCCCVDRCRFRRVGRPRRARRRTALHRRVGRPVLSLAPRRTQSLLRHYSCTTPPP